MIKKMDKIKLWFNRNKKIIIFLSIIGLIGLIFGSFLTVMLNSDDKKLVTEYINNFINNIKDSNFEYSELLKNKIISFSIYAIFIWILGISVVGVPLIIFMYFSKIFILGFSISGIITTLGFKGCLIALIYVFPHHIINIIMITILAVYSLKVSANILYGVLKNTKIDFKVILNKYFRIFLLSSIIGIVMVLFEVYITPNLIKQILSIL